MDAFVENHIHPHNRADLRSWLENCTNDGFDYVWVIIYKKKANHQLVNYEEVVEEAICFGLIDTKIKTVNQDCYAICLRKRKNNSSWTDANKNIASKMIKNKLMHRSGMSVYKGRLKT
jgi:uncharacterized protein YdeI (YjbR/CyaY-like superfamily)